MKMKRHIITAIVSAAAILATSCTDDKEQIPAGNDKSTFVNLTLAAYESADGFDDNLTLQAAHACLFEDGFMTEVYETPVLEGGSYGFRVGKKTGTLYVVADAIDMETLNGLRNRGIGEDEWLGLTIGSNGNLPRRFASGRAELSGNGVGTIAMTRGTARFDLHVRAVGTIEIESLTLTGVATGTKLFDSAHTPEIGLGEITIRPSEPYSEDTRGVAYLYEQTTHETVLTVEAVIDGREEELSVGLPPAIRRNCIYVISITRDVAESDAVLSVDPWEAGEDTEVVPGFGSTIRVDDAASELPAGVVLSDDRTMITMPYGAAELVMALDCDSELELQEVADRNLTVEHIAGDGGPAAKNVFRISKRHFTPDMPAGDVDVLFRRKGLNNVYAEDRITLRLEANPTVIEGEMSFADGAVAYDFGRYVDNELGRFTLPQGKNMSVEFADGEDPWVKLVPADDNDRTIRVLGGWKPNDPTADGRTQSATLVICNDDGSQREEYTVSRRNYGLPVTWFHGVWWCKYNARGNSRDFDDQILSSSDPAAAAGKRVIDYLRDCSPEEFYDLWGWAYQGDSGQGMRVIDDNGKLVMEGFSTDSKSHINKLPSDALSPEGYELPSMEEFNRMFDATDYVWIMWSGTHTLRTPWEGHSSVKREQRRRNDITVGTVAATDLLYTGMWSPGFSEYEPVTWYGPGAQWNSDGIMHSNHYNNILFAVHSPEGSGWYFNGSMAGLYLTKNGAGTKDTRILRFKKSPVEYIYGME